MRYAQARRAQRAGGGAVASEITVPLPLKGMFSEAKTAEISGIYAGELLNWRSNGVSLEFRQPTQISGDGSSFLQRIPFEFGGASEYIGIGETSITAGGQTLARSFAQKHTAAYISGNAVLADGNGAAVLYNGTTLSEASFTTSTGKDAGEFDGVVAHQDRLFFWEEGDELDFYYGEVGAITGTLTRFPLGRLGNITGRIVAIRSMTVDAGHGMNDTLGIFTSTGMAVVYEGLDPGDAQDWRQLARVQMAPPVARDAFVNVGADVWMLTATGVVSVSQTLRESTIALAKPVSRAVRDTIAEQVKEGGDWSMHLGADGAAVVINRVLAGTANQFVYRTETRAWDTTNYQAKEWHNLGLVTQFTGTDGALVTLDAGEGDLITARWVTGWFRMPRRSGLTFLRPTIRARGALTVTVILLADHNETASDIAEATQTITIEPENPADTGGMVALDELIALDATGTSFQITMEVTATWAELVDLTAGVM